MEIPFWLRGPKDAQLQGARSPASEAYYLYAATKQDERNDADGRHAVPGLRRDATCSVGQGTSFV
jgi:hypothetical protein